MASRSSLVNLDAMIRRQDFALQDSQPDSHFENVSTIAVRDFLPNGLNNLLRKPDFQRETNHWDPDQVVSLLECYANGDLIPSVILWRSATVVFVIDGGHRLSVLRAWVEDDYGDGPISKTYFGDAISSEQKRAAARVRNLVKERLGTWQHFQAKVESTDLPEAERRRISTVITRGIPIQWVPGNAEKAENSFFKINTKGTPLDDIEELLLRNRKRPGAIASRAVIRAGMGHRYWSRFAVGAREKIETQAKEIHDTLFQPELTSPVKTLELPLGGSTGVRTALQVLNEYMLTADRDQLGNPKKLADQAEDTDGTATQRTLENALRLANRITGNDNGSLGLHPAIYFYGPSGKHLSPMFLGTVTLIARKLANNDSGYFAKFTQVRSRLEDLLIEQKDLIATVLQKTISHKRTVRYADLLGALVDDLLAGKAVTDSDIVNHAGLVGKIVTGSFATTAVNFTDDTKSEVFIARAMKSAIRCPICNGYLDPAKSISYDHVQEKSKGGKGDVENCQLTHPYCNQTVKNQAARSTPAI